MSAHNHSAGVVLYRRSDDTVQIMLVHPGGPFWANKDQHGWSIPKGEFDPTAEDGRSAAWREFAEELGKPVPPPGANANTSEAIELPTFRAGRKTIHAWLVDADFDTTEIASNTTEIEWPPRSGRMMTIPEVDRAEWFGLDEARTRLHKGQIPIVDLIEAALTEPDHRAV